MDNFMFISWVSVLALQQLIEFSRSRVVEPDGNRRGIKPKPAELPAPSERESSP